MMRKFSLRLAVSLAVLVGLGWPLPLRAEVRVPAAVNLEALSATQAGTSTVLAVQADAPFRYQTYRASQNSLWIDLEDVDLGSVARSGSFRGALVGYRVALFNNASGKPVVRLHVLLKRPTGYTVKTVNSGLRVAFGPNEVAAASENRTRGMTLGVSRTTSSSTGASRKADANRKSQAAPSTKSGNSGPLFVVKVIEILENGTTQIKIETSRPAPYKVLRLSNPPRLVVDLVGARSHVGRLRTFSTTSPFLERIRLAQFRDDPAVVRVVADLAGTPRYRVKAVDGGVQIRLGDSLEALTRAEGASSKPVASVEEAEPREVFRAGKAPSVAPAKTADSSNQSSDKPESVPAPVTTPSSSAATAAAGDDAEHETEIVSAPKPPISVASAESVPPAEPEKIGTPRRGSLSEKEVREVEAALPPSASSTRVTAAVRRDPKPDPHAIRAAQAARTLARSLAPRSAALPQDVPAAQEGEEATSELARAAAAAPRYTGEPISVNLKDVDLKDFFRLTHEISGLNLIIDPNVIGSVTLVLDSVPWDQALDIVLKNNRLGRVLEDNVLRIATLQTLAAEAEQLAELGKARLQAAPLVTIFRTLSYARAADVMPTLQRFLSVRGEMIQDDRTNTLIISEIESEVENLDRVLARLDRKAKQISIEARIVLASRDFARSFGIQLGFATANSSTAVSGGGIGNIPVPSPQGPTFRGAGAFGSTSAAPVIVSVPAPGPVSGSIFIVNASSKYRLDALLSLGESTVQAKTISRPSLVTQDNMQAVVRQGARIPIQTVINNTPTTTYIDALLRLTVTPQVTEDGHIFLDVNVENSSPGAPDQHPVGPDQSSGSRWEHAGLRRCIGAGADEVGRQDSVVGRHSDPRQPVQEHRRDGQRQRIHLPDHSEDHAGIRFQRPFGKNLWESEGGPWPPSLLLWTR